MYAHQVIEDLKRERSRRSNGSAFIDEKIETIAGSQQFFVKSDKQTVINAGGMNSVLPDHLLNRLGFEMDDVFEGPKMPEDLTGVSMPYSQCFFSFLIGDYAIIDPYSGAVIAKQSKMGVLADYNYTNSLATVFIFGFHPLLRLWQAFPFWALVRLDDDFSGPKKQTDMFLLKKPAGDVDDQISALVQTYASIAVFLNTLKTLSCKNITTNDNHPPEKLNKKRIKNGKQPLFTYKTLVIKPTSKKQEAQEAQGLWENRVHLCRGHFKTYTDKNPLFGSHTGRYWWQPVVRGNKEKGIVMKDYEIRTA